MTKLAFVFPGQGSQSVGMLNALSHHALVQTHLNRANEVLGYDLAKLIQEGPAEDLNKTTNTQPAMLVAGYVAYLLWQDKNGVVPVLAAGHSLGEYTALTAAGVFSFEDAVKLVRLRAEAMQVAATNNPGKMAAILGLDQSKVIEACAAAAQNEVVQVVNFNSTSQVVISGHAAAVERACQLSQEYGAKRAVMLPVSGAFHSRLMEPAQAALRDALSTVTVNSPKFDVINNVDVAISNDPAVIRDALIRQVSSPVRWVETLDRIAQLGTTHLYEVGPGKVLLGLMRKLAGPSSIGAIADDESIDAALASLNA